MKTYTIAALFIIAVAFGTATASAIDSAATSADEANFVDWNQFLLCVGHGTIFNGRKTCQLGCMTVCQQPGCGGYSKCEQIPNPGESSTYLHKYKCHCKSP